MARLSWEAGRAWDMNSCGRGAGRARGKAAGAYALRSLIGLLPPPPHELPLAAHGEVGFRVPEVLRDLLGTTSALAWMLAAWWRRSRRPMSSALP
jgi:hypothetical protein